MTDSPEVSALRAQLDARPQLSLYMRKRVHKRIRAQRLIEARARGTHSESQWVDILERFDYRCVQCGCRPEGRPCKDHIVPIYQGGSDDVDNLQPLCRECNTAKGPDCFNWAAYREAFGFGDVDGW